MRRLIPHWLGGGGAAKGKGRKQRRRARWMRPALYGAGLFILAAGIAGGAYWIWSTDAVSRLGDRIETAYLNTSLRAGLAVDHIFVEGRKETSRGQLLQAIGVARGDPILTLDTQAIRNRLIRLGWIADATIERRLPDTIYVRLRERRPMAIWQREGRFLPVPPGNARKAVPRGSACCHGETRLHRHADDLGASWSPPDRVT